MTPPVAPVLVVGSGPTGLAAALALLQNKVPVRIIDKEPHYRIGQKANGIWPRTCEVFHFLRAHDINRTGESLNPVREYQSGTFEPVKSYVMYPRKDSTPSIPYHNPIIIGQPRLEGILRSNLEKYGCQVELATELQSFEHNEERVLAKLVKRKDGEEITETFEASYLIGADGAKGITRKQLGLSFLGETRKNMSLIVGDICLEVEGLDRVHWHIFGSATSNLLTLRAMDDIGPGGFQFILSSSDHDTTQLLANQELMFQCMSKILGREMKVTKVVFASEFRPNIRMVDRFGLGRVFVAGDAAHVHSPTGGQGLNTSIQDSFNLAWKISLVYKGLSPDSLLDSYNTERLPVVAEMLNVTTGYLNKANAPSMEGAMKREERMNMLGVNYRTSPIVLDEFSQAEPCSAYGELQEGVLVAGDRAPDAPGLTHVAGSSITETETRLFDVFSATYHTVLVFVADVASAADVVQALTKYGEVVRTIIVLPRGSPSTTTTVATVGQADVVVDRDGYAYTSYLAKDEKKVVAVRPDGVVGAMARGVEGVGKYFSKILL